MRFECRDLERALRTPELMPDAQAHAQHCEDCRRELYLWSEISNLAPGLHEEWESPELWPSIQESLRVQQKSRPRRQPWWWMAAVAAGLIVGVALWHPWNQPQTTAASDRAFLTDQALREVELAESAYARSIEKLARLAEAKLERDASPLAASYREKLLLIDSAIKELKTNADANRYNASLRVELTSLYRQKQQTLEEVLRNDPGN